MLYEEAVGVQCIEYFFVTEEDTQRPLACRHVATVRNEYG